MKEILIELDERRRASFGRVGRPEHTRYLAHTEDDGTIIMRPVELVPAVVGTKPATLEPAGTAEVDQAFAEVRRVEDALKRLRQFRQPPQAHAERGSPIHEGGDR